MPAYVTPSQLREILNGELQKFEVCIDCSVDRNVIRLRNSRPGKLNWSLSVSLRCGAPEGQGFSEGSALSAHPCGAVAAKVIEDAAARYLLSPGDKPIDITIAEGWPIAELITFLPLRAGLSHAANSEDVDWRSDLPEMRELVDALALGQDPAAQNSPNIIHLTWWRDMWREWVKNYPAFEGDHREHLALLEETVTLLLPEQGTP